MAGRPIRFAPLLFATLAALLLSAPLAELGWSRLASLITLPAVILAAVIAVLGTGRAGGLVVSLWAITVVGEVLAQTSPGRLYAILGRCIDALFLFFLLGVVLHQLVRSARVSLDTVLGGICGYLLLGFAFVALFGLTELLVPGSFLDRGISLEELILPGAAPDRFPSLTYYSFITLTTLGFGDVTPVGAVARSLSILEAISGQLYLTILIGALVGLHLADRRREGRSE